MFYLTIQRSCTDHEWDHSESSAGLSALVLLRILIVALLAESRALKRIVRVRSIFYGTDFELAA